MEDESGAFLGEQLRRWRKSMGLTLDQVAADLDTSKGYLSEMERNVKPLSTRWLAKMAAFYKVPVSEIIGAPQTVSDAEVSDLVGEWADWAKELKAAGQYETAVALVRALLDSGKAAVHGPVEREKAASKSRKAR